VRILAKPSLLATKFYFRHKRGEKAFYVLNENVNLHAGINEMVEVSLMLIKNCLCMDVLTGSYENNPDKIKHIKSFSTVPEKSLRPRVANGLEALDGKTYKCH